MTSSSEDSKEVKKPHKNEALHTFVHTSRYIVILENTLRYLLHLLGLNRFLNDTRIANYQHKNQIDYLENEIKVCVIIKRVFEFIKQWFYVYYNYKVRENRIKIARAKLKTLKDLLKNGPPQHGKDDLSHVRTIEENVNIEECKNELKDALSSLSDVNTKLYGDISDSVKINYKLLNYTIKYLNNPEYYVKSSHLLSGDDSKTVIKHDQSTMLKHVERKVKNYKPTQVFRSLFPDKGMLDLNFNNDF